MKFISGQQTSLNMARGKYVTSKGNSDEGVIVT